MSNLPVWKQQLSTAQSKMVNILDEERVMSELGFASQIFEGNPSLQKCDPSSIMNAVVNIARTSVTINPVMKLAYLIPRKNKCILEFSYMGLIKMLKDYGAIKHIEAHIVFEDEEFTYDASQGKIYHTPSYAETEQEHEKRKIKGAYSVATLPTGDKVYCFMPMWEIDKVKRNSDGANSKYSAWNTWRDEMIKKSVIKRHFKTLISGSPDHRLQSVLKIEEENNQLVNQFGKDNKPSLMRGFDEYEEVKEQSEPIKEQSEAIKEQPEPPKEKTEGEKLMEGDPIPVEFQDHPEDLFDRETGEIKQ